MWFLFFFLAPHSGSGSRICSMGRDNCVLPLFHIKGDKDAMAISNNDGSTCCSRAKLN